MSTTGDLLSTWREAQRATEVAQRLATLAAEAVAQANDGIAASEEIVMLAEAAASAAEQAASTARTAAERARGLGATKEIRSVDAQEALLAARDLEATAMQRYHDAEREALRRHVDGAAPSL